MDIKLSIENKGEIYFPTVVDSMTLETERKGTPSSLNFKVIKDELLNFTEGDIVRLIVDGVPMFYGYVFTKTRDKENIIAVTAYDQLRYFKNKDTYMYADKTTGELIKMLCADFNMQYGTIEDTGYKIPQRIEKDTTLLDMVLTSIDQTLETKKQLYVMYDDYGKICLKNIANMMVDFIITEKTAENFTYTSSIDQNTYNKVKLVYESEKEGLRNVFIEKDDVNISNWGVLQYFETLKDNENGKAKAQSLLSLYNKKSRALFIKNVFGNLKVRGGCMVYVRLNLGDIFVKNLMLVEKCKHIFEGGTHVMTLTLSGGEFNAGQ